MGSTNLVYIYNILKSDSNSELVFRKLVGLTTVKVF